MDWIERIPHRQTLFAVFALAVFGSTAVDIVSEFMDGESILEMLDDVALFALSGWVIVLFAVEYRAQQRALKELRGQLENARGQLAQMDAKTGTIVNQYREVMQKQFASWQLTESEQDVVLSLLKGLSFREIAELRETQEKTVRQQATGVYKKAGVAGRHELAAWFFEDMLEPPSAH